MEIRFARAGDGDAIAAIYAPIVAQTAISFETVAPDGHEMSARITAHPANRPWLVAERDGRAAGYAYASAFRGRAAYRWSAETTVYVDETMRRHGIARALYVALLGILEAQGYRRAFAGITLPNAPSERLHRVIGFSDVGIFRAAGNKFGAWHDLLMMQRDVAPLTVPEHDPIAIADVHPDAIAAILRGAAAYGSDRERT